MQNVFRLSYAQSCWGKKFPLRFRQQRLLKTSCWSPPLPHACCLPSPGSLFQHEVGLQPAPSRQAALLAHPARPEGSPTGGGHMPAPPPNLATSDGFCLAGVSALRRAPSLPRGCAHRRWFLKPRSPHASGSVRPTDGWQTCLAWLSAGAKAHLIHYIQLGHLFWRLVHKRQRYKPTTQGTPLGQL